MLKHVRKNMALLVLAGGAGAVFLANLAARKLFTIAQFIDWAYLTSLTTLFFSFSLLGSEQLIVRSAKGTGSKIEVPRQVAKYVSASFAAFLLIYIFVLDGRIFAYRLGMASIPLLACIGTIQFVYQMERARGHLLASQLAFNAWKIALLPLVGLVAALAPDHRAECSVAAALLFGAVSAGVVFRRARHAITFGGGITDAATVFPPFMLSLGMMAALGVADRVVLEKTHHPDAFAGYVYLATILATPFSILSSYFGFKEAVRYRHCYSRAGARADTLRAMVLTTALFIGWSALCYVTRHISGISFDAMLWAVMGMLAVVRCGYAVLSAAMGVRGSAKAIYTANLLTAAALLAYSYIALRADASVAAIIGGYASVWALRFVAFFWLIQRSAPRPAVSPDVGLA